MNFNVKPNFKEVGKIFGPKIKLFGELLQNLSREDETKLLNNEEITTKFDGEDLTITPSMVDIRIEAKEGFNVGMQNNVFVILNIEITEELLLEGVAREVVSKVQNMRKTKEFEIMDRIKLYYSGEEKVMECFDKYKELIMSETLATELVNEERGEKQDLNGFEATLDVEKNN